MDTLDKKINNLTWYDGIGKLKQILKSLKDNTPQPPEAPYKVYTALLSQEGENPPTAIVLENTLGGTPIFGYIENGTYSITLNGVFLETKTTCIISQQYSNLPFPEEIGYASIYRLSNNQINIEKRDLSFSRIDNYLENTFVEIRVYN